MNGSGGKGAVETEETIKDIVGNLETRGSGSEGHPGSSSCLLLELTWSGNKGILQVGHKGAHHSSSVSTPWSSIPSCTQIKRVN